MKIAWVDQSFHWPPTGGSWLDLRETAIRLQRSGLDMKIFTFQWERWNIPGGRISSDPGIPVHVIPIKPYQFNFHSLPRCLEPELTAWKPDCIVYGNTFSLAPYLIGHFSQTPSYLRIYAHELICHNYMGLFKGNVFEWDHNNPTGQTCGNTLFATPFQCWWCGLRRMAGTLRPHRMNPVAFEYWSGLGFLPFFSHHTRTALNRLNGILVSNPFIKRLFQDIDARIHIVPGGVDTDHFRPLNPKPPSESLKILMSGRSDDTRKGFSVFERSIRRLKDQSVNFKVYVTDSRTSFRHDLIQSTGWVSPVDLPRLYNTMDIIVCPSIWPEPFGIVPLESMACGIPVIGSRIGGIQYTIRHGETGFLFLPGDDQSLSDYLSLLITKPEIRIQMGINGRNRMTSLFNWDHVVSHYTLPIITGQVTQELDWTLDTPSSG